MLMNKINPHKLNQISLNNRNKIQNNSNLKHHNRSFEEVLQQINSKNNEIKFSKHAIERMDSRNIRLNDTEYAKLENAMSKAENKGIKEALILMDNKAFIASIKSRTIITTTSSERMQENVFTNIDGAVII